MESGSHSSGHERKAQQMPIINSFSPDRRQTMPAISKEDIRNAVRDSEQNEMTGFLRDTNIAPIPNNNPEHFAQTGIPAISPEDLRQAVANAEAEQRGIKTAGAIQNIKDKILGLFGKK